MRDNVREIVVHTHSAEERKIQQNGPVFFRAKFLLAKIKKCHREKRGEGEHNISTTE